MTIVDFEGIAEAGGQAGAVDLAPSKEFGNATLTQGPGASGLFVGIPDAGILGGNNFNFFAADFFPVSPNAVLSPDLTGAPNGQVIVTFAQPTTGVGGYFLDAEGAQSFIEAFDENDVSLGKVIVQNAGDNSQKFAGIIAEGISRAVFSLGAGNDGVGLDDLCFVEGTPIEFDVVATSSCTDGQGEGGACDGISEPVLITGTIPVAGTVFIDLLTGSGSFAGGPVLPASVDLSTATSACPLDGGSASVSFDLTCDPPGMDGSIECAITVTGPNECTFEGTCGDGPIADFDLVCQDLSGLTGALTIAGDGSIAADIEFVTVLDLQANEDTCAFECTSVGSDCPEGATCIELPATVPSTDTCGDPTGEACGGLPETIESTGGALSFLGTLALEFDGEGGTGTYVALLDPPSGQEVSFNGTAAPVDDGSLNASVLVGTEVSGGGCVPGVAPMTYACDAELTGTFVTTGTVDFGGGDQAWTLESNGTFIATGTVLLAAADGTVLDFNISFEDLPSQLSFDDCEYTCSSTGAGCQNPSGFESTINIGIATDPAQCIVDEMNITLVEGGYAVTTESCLAFGDGTVSSTFESEDLSGTTGFFALPGFSCNDETSGGGVAGTANVDLSTCDPPLPTMPPLAGTSTCDATLQFLNLNVSGDGNDGGGDDDCKGPFLIEPDCDPETCDGIGGTATVTLDDSGQIVDLALELDAIPAQVTFADSDGQGTPLTCEGIGSVRECNDDDGSGFELCKDLVGGPLDPETGEIALVVPVGQETSSAYQFRISQNNPSSTPAQVRDTVPGEWDVDGLAQTPDVGFADASPAGKGKSPATKLVWEACASEVGDEPRDQVTPEEQCPVDASLTVAANSRLHASGRFAPTACGPLYLNRAGAVALELDDDGNLVLVDGEPVELGSTPGICLAAVEDLTDDGVACRQVKTGKKRTCVDEVNDGTVANFPECTGCGVLDLSGAGDEDGDTIPDFAEACELGTDPCVCDLDADGDGFVSAGVCGGLDCDDNNDAVFPGATEICDNIDNNCNGDVDEGGVCE